MAEYLTPWIDLGFMQVGKQVIKVSYAWESGKPSQWALELAYVEETMSYYGVDTRSLYGACRSQYEGTPAQQAIAWVEAENTYAIWKIVQAWYEMMEAGTAQYQYPDPDWRDGDLLPLTQEQADGMVAEIDADFEVERNRFPESGLGPEFSRLLPHARMAFAQAIYGVLLTEAQLAAEAQRRVAQGEVLPPSEVSGGVATG